MWKAYGLFGLAALTAGCSSPDLEGKTFSCTSDADCSEGQLCGTQNGVLACVGLDAEPIRLGMSGPLQGPSQDLGIEMRRGILALFQRVNDEGGLFGRELELETLNDNYDPVIAAQNTRRLLDIQQTVADPDAPDVRGTGSVLALMGNIGTPTMLATAPIANKNQVVFFGPFTGAQSYLRDGTNSPYVYNYRAGYYEEAEAMVDYMAEFRLPRIITGPDSYQRILAFTQRDSYGDAGYNGLVNAYNTRIAPLPEPDSSALEPSIQRIYYEREDVSSVDPAIAEAERFLTNVLSDGPLGDGAAGGSTAQSVAIVMIDTYQPGSKFIRAIKDWLNADLTRATGLDVLFIHVSFVGSDALSQALTSPPETFVDVTDPSGATRRSYAEGVMVTQVVPHYGTQGRAAQEYRDDLDALDAGELSFTSFEGYVVARLFVEAAQRAGLPLDSESLVDALDSRIINLDVGTGTFLNFSSVNHQASHTVWGSVLDASGAFSIPFIWDPTDRIRAAE